MSKRLSPRGKPVRVHFATLKRWIYAGKIKAIRWMMLESEVERIIGGG